MFAHHLKFLAGLALACVFHAALAAAPETPRAKPATGTLEQVSIHSTFVDDRPVEVWLPEGYAERAKAGHRYRVLYMHDGQMLFDPTVTWNKQAWHVDATLGRLMREGKVADTIVVAIWNNGKFRASEYFPQKFLDYMPKAVRDSYIQSRLENRPQADNYLRFLVKELKPLIDSRYATKADAANTFIMGSSMGGLISVYAYTEYPDVFGGAAGLSTHWVGTFVANASIPMAGFEYLNKSLPAPQNRRLYLDRGTETLDALYGPSQTFIDEIIREHGYTDANYVTRVFNGANHSEAAWAERLEIPLLALLAPR